MGAEFTVESLEDMCRLMCDNYVPKRQQHKCSECKWLSDEKCTIGYKCVNPDKHWRTKTAMWKYKHTPSCRMFEEQEIY